MELFLKLGDQTISITFIGHAQRITGTENLSMDAHRVVLGEAVNGDTESILFDTEAEAIQFVREFLDPDGYPPGGIYDKRVTGQSFKM